MPENALDVWTVSCETERKSPFSKILGYLWIGPESVFVSFSDVRFVKWMTFLLNMSHVFLVTREWREWMTISKFNVQYLILPQWLQNISCTVVRETGVAWPVPGSKIVVKSGSVKRNAKNSRGLGRDSPSRTRLIFALRVLIRPHYTIWEPGTS